MRQGRRKRQRRNGHAKALNLGFRPGGIPYSPEGDLVNRATFTNLVSTNVTVYFRDSAATNFNQRFYRAVVP